MVDFVWPKYMGDHPRNGCSWSVEESQELLRGWFDDSKDVHRLAIKHGRTDLSIECQLAKLLGFKDHEDFRRSVRAPRNRTTEYDRLVRLEFRVTGLVGQLNCLTNEVKSLRRMIGDDR